MNTYVKCPSCRYPISMLVEEIDNRIKTIENNPKLSGDEIRSAKSAVYTSYGLLPCCIMRLMTPTDTFSIINEKSNS